MTTYIKGRGSQLNPTNRFEKASKDIYLDDLATDEERHALVQARRLHVEDALGAGARRAARRLGDERHGRRLVQEP